MQIGGQIVQELYGLLVCGYPLMLVIALLAFIFLQTPAPKAAQHPSLDQRGTSQAPFVVKVVPTPKTQEEIAQEVEDRKQKAANDTNLVVATFILAGIGALQLFVFGYQAVQLRKTVQAAVGQSAAMERYITEANRSATAMEKVAVHIETSSKAGTASLSSINQQMRAYLCAVIDKGLYQDRTNNIKFQASPSIINAGLTPAYKVFFRSRAAILPLPLPKDFMFPLPKEAVGGSVIGPRQNINISPIVEGFCDDSEVESIKRASGGKALYAWGMDLRSRSTSSTTRTTRCRTESARLPS
jgi:hypothetical protein